MELKMEVYDATLTLLGILETYDAVIIDDRAFQPGSFSLESIANSTAVSLLRPGHIIWLEGETAGVIECVQAVCSGAGQTLSVRGCLLAGLLSRRILWGIYNLSGSPPQLMYDMVQDCAIMPTRGDTAQRVIPNLMLDGAPPADTRTVRKQSTGAVLTSFLTELAQANQVAYGVRFDPATPKMAFWARVGVDRTVGQSAVDPVLLSTELDDVLSSEYSYDSSSYCNVALVAGEGEGEERKQIVKYRDGKSILPDGYVELEYIEGTGTQCIDTGIYPSSDLLCKIEIEDCILPIEAEYGILGSSWVNNGFFLSYSKNSIRWHTRNVVPHIDTDISKRIKIKVSYSELYVNGNIVPVSGSGEDVQTTICIYTTGEYKQGFGFMGRFKLFCVEFIRNGKLISKLIPCKNSTSDKVGVYDSIRKVFLGNVGTGVFACGPEQLAFEPSGNVRRETFVDARDLQSTADPDAPLTEEEYRAALSTRGQEALADAPLVQSFSASVRTRDATYRYGEDFLLGDTVTVMDERLGVSVSAVVEGVERSVGRTGEDMVLTLGYGLPTLADRLRKAGV